ncbi:MAG: hypothetical protein GX902_06580 [Lentisphaerae bacterium]|nr:hypothetical protein [Lentisphaerota bacterium]
MGKRHEAIGIKQEIRLEWMQKAANLLLAGLNAQTIRKELHEFLADRKGSGSEGKRSGLTRTFVVNNLMNIWITPAPELIPFRDAALALLHDLPAPQTSKQPGTPSMSLAIHWGMISAAYPFWFNVARQAGRLLALQDQVTQAQIINRLKEQYGDRQTVSRYARFVIRSFIAWSVLKDSKARGCYEKAAVSSIADTDVAILLIESALHADPKAKSSLAELLHNPGLFPFQLPIITGDFIARQNHRIEVFRYGLDEELLQLHTESIPSRK